MFAIARMARMLFVSRYSRLHKNISALFKSNSKDRSTVRRDAWNSFYFCVYSIIYFLFVEYLCSVCDYVFFLFCKRKVWGTKGVFRSRKLKDRKHYGQQK